MSKADVLIHPTYVETFGMVALEALSHGLAIITTDVYALSEIVIDQINGRVLEPPVSIWNNYLPSALYYNLQHSKDIIEKTDTKQFEHSLSQAILQYALNHCDLVAAQKASVNLMKERFC